jgi:hypothetical protein
MIRVAQCYTGGVGSEIIRRLTDHPRDRQHDAGDDAGDRGRQHHLDETREGRRFVLLEPQHLGKRETFERGVLHPLAKLALAEHVTGAGVAGKVVLELGCGLAVPSLAAALCGADVLATDWAPEAIALAEQNALGNGVSLRAALLRWDAPDLPPRHRSLHATLDWSYVLLTAHQQALFRRLAVFVGGFSLEGAEVVGHDPNRGATDPDEAGGSVLEDLAALIHHNLVQRVASSLPGEPRYRVLETVREYGLERLSESGEADSVRRRQLTYLVELAEARLPAAEIIQEVAQ